jgi:hypothetical protein
VEPYVKTVYYRYCLLNHGCYAVTATLMGASSRNAINLTALNGAPSPSLALCGAVPSWGLAFRQEFELNGIAVKRRATSAA